MFRNLSIMLGIAGVCALAAGGIAVAAGGFSHDGGAHDQTLTLLDITQQTSFVDVDGSNGPPTPGDELILTDVLKTRDGSRTVGHLHASCTFFVTPPTGAATLHCAGTAMLARGSLEFAGTGTATETSSLFNLALTGGTGIYDETHGQVLVRQISPDRSAVTIDIDA